MKRNFWFILVFLAVVYSSCKRKEKKNNFVSAISYIQSQIKNVDTSLYSIIKAEKTETDSTWDTTYVRREDFRLLAKDFLDIPDITSPSLAKNYKEESRYDDQLGRAILSYTPIKDGQEIEREDFLIAQGDTSFNKMKSVIIERIKNIKDSTIHQHLLWQTDEKFQVVTIIEKNGQTISAKTIEVTWDPEVSIQNNIPNTPDTTASALKSRHRIDSLRRIREEKNK